MRTATTEPDVRRVAEFERVLAGVQAWAVQQTDVTAVGLAGSWARGVPSMDSDVDLVVLCTDPGRFERTTNWVSEALAEDAPVIRTRHWGELLERRVLTQTGLEVEFGFAPPSWAATKPVDAGTARVVGDGFRVLYDPGGILHALVGTRQTG